MCIVTTWQVFIKYWDGSCPGLHHLTWNDPSDVMGETEMGVVSQMGGIAWFRHKVKIVLAKPKTVGRESVYILAAASSSFAKIFSSLTRCIVFFHIWCCNPSLCSNLQCQQQPLTWWPSRDCSSYICFPATWSRQLCYPPF